MARNEIICRIRAVGRFNLHKKDMREQSLRIRFRKYIPLQVHHVDRIFVWDYQSISINHKA